MLLNQIITTDEQIIEAFIQECIAENKSLMEGDLSEGLLDNLKKKAAKVGDAVEKMKGAPTKALQKIHMNVWNKVQDKLSDEQSSKVMNFVKKNSKYVKPALMLAVVGAALMGVDTSGIDQVIDNLDQLNPQELDAAMEPVEQEIVQGGDESPHQSTAGSGGGTGEPAGEEQVVQGGDESPHKSTGGTGEEQVADTGSNENAEKIKNMLDKHLGGKHTYNGQELNAEQMADFAFKQNGHNLNYDKLIDFALEKHDDPAKAAEMVYNYINDGYNEYKNGGMDRFKSGEWTNS